MPDLSRYRAIVFDMDGTLIDSMGVHLQAWKQTCEHFGYPFERAYIHSLGGVPTRQTAVLLNKRYQLMHDVDAVAEQKHQAWQSLQTGNPLLIDETYQVLLRHQGKLKMGIGTGADRPSALQILHKTDLLSRIETLVTASDVSHGKPHPETFLTVAQNMGIPPGECVVFEDTDIGRQAAHAAGMDCIMVVDGRIQHP